MPFTPAQFFEVFRSYNEAVWPAQLALVGLALLTLALAAAGGARVGRAAAALLGAFWIWAGVAYHLTFFASINRAAIVFGVLFVVEGGLLIWESLRRPVPFRFSRSLNGAAGCLFAFYALVLYPIAGFLLGHRYPAMPTFGLPCPLTIFTFGVLLLSQQHVPLRLLVIPAAWSLVGTSAAISLGVIEDYGLLIAGILGTALILRYNLTIGRTAGTRPAAAASTPRPASATAARPR